MHVARIQINKPNITSPIKPHQFALHLMPNRGLWDSWAWRPFCPPIHVAKTPGSMTFSEFQRAEQFANQGRSSQETTWGRSSSTLGDGPPRTLLVAQMVKIRICLQCRKPRFDPWVGKIPWRREWQPTPVSLPGKSHGQRSLGSQCR